jgi:selenide, water dikinase
LKMQEAHCSIVGGHSIRTDDMLFGYSVTGTIHPERIWRNVGARAGDVLLFTKPLGTGVITTALKKERALQQSLGAAIQAMTTLNAAAAEALHEVEKDAAAENPIHAVTDVTGFSFLGHAREMALGNPSTGIPPVSFEIEHTSFTYLPGAHDAAREGHLSGGLKNNRAFIGDCVEFGPNVSPEYQSLLFDPQTSGGLLISIDARAAELATQLLGQCGAMASPVGIVLQKQTPLIHVT